MSYEDLLIQKCRVYRKTSSIGSRGQSNISWIDIFDRSIKCNIQLSTVRTEYGVIERGERTNTQYDGYFKYEDDIREGDKVVCEDTSYHVSQISPSVTGRKKTKEAILEIIK